MDDTRTALFGQFREEVDTHLLRLSQGVVALEQDPENAALLKEIFRSAHTVKGAAKMMGFPEIARVTHELESVLGAMRDGQLRLTGDISDLLFEGIDTITVLIQAEASPGDPQAVVARSELHLDGIIARLQAIANGRPAAAAGAASVTAPSGDGAALRALDAPPLLPTPPGSNGVDHGPPTITLKLGEDSVRVRVQKLDTLMNLSGEMIITKMQHQAAADDLRALMDLARGRTRRLEGLADQVDQAWGGINQGDMTAELEELRRLDGEFEEQAGRLLRQFQEHTAHLASVADELEDTVLSVRMLPIETLFATFPRAVRDFKRETGKEVELQVRGGETELDKQILEALNDPLIHLLRNALDHGIEPPRQREAAGKPAQGRVTVRAFQQGSQVVIEVSDDGAGMDPEKLRRAAVQKGLLSRAEAGQLSDEEARSLIFAPGFSTAGLITDVSGRGVGMDIVKSTVERLNGMVSLDSTPGQGTRVTLRLPLTLATMQALLVRVGSHYFVLPAHTIEGGMEYIGAEDMLGVENREAVRVHGRTMPLIRLAELLDLGRADVGPAGGALPPMGSGIRLANKLPGVIVGSGERQACFLVDELIDELDVVVKNLGPLLARVETAIGATILGNGRVVIILDVPSLLAEARIRNARGQLGRPWRPAPPARRPHILVVDDSITTRELEKSILENAGYEVDLAMDGLEALAKLEEQGQNGRAAYDLMIADIEMPRMDGLELTWQVKSHERAALRALPVIIVSSLASEAYKLRGIQVGAQAYITKGQFDQSHLLETIDVLIH